ncbi:sigma factor-like helix-turn-helix DNA-binding protein [Nocardia sp. NPDC023852]|uniref:sigma factor-like helix-turn-helix DNA-binding protein n=1 Tax=Nocardia sp. NPDC023852 TaxID=3154697 RepID=UPI0033DCD235
MIRDDLEIAAWEQRHDILRVLRELPPRQRQVMAWTLADYTPTEIASILPPLTPEAVRSSLRRARRNLAIRLKASEEQ